jgi:hypothetical protein
LVFLQRDYLVAPSAGRATFHQIPEPQEPGERATWHLQWVLFAAHEANWGEACTCLTAALDLLEESFPPDFRDDWMRASAVLIHLGFGARLLEFLEQRGENLRRRPWFEAVRAAEANQPELLKNVAPEVRLPAEQLLAQIQQRLSRLPEATRKRPVVAQPGGRRKRK